MCYSQFFLTKLPTLGTLYSTVVRAMVVANLVIPGISFSASLILALRVVVLATLLIPAIFSSTFLIFYYIT